MLGHVKGWYLPQLSPKLTAKLWHPAHSTGERSGTAPGRRTYFGKKALLFYFCFCLWVT